MSTSQVIKAMIMSKDEGINKSVTEVVYGMQISDHREKQYNTVVPRWKGCRGSSHARKSQ
jgi:hypothetical protein